MCEVSAYVWWDISRRHAGQQQFAEVAKQQQQYLFSWSLCSSLWFEWVCVFFLLPNRIYPFLLKTWLQAHNHHTNMFLIALYSLIFGFGIFFFSLFIPTVCWNRIECDWECVRNANYSVMSLSFSARQILVFDVSKFVQGRFNRLIA